MAGAIAAVRKRTAGQDRRGAGEPRLGSAGLQSEPLSIKAAHFRNWKVAYQGGQGGPLLL